ncbi:hypothetical protein M3Y96_00649000 [Aphelenchoides besseyi]|nr:hypothetical protein M3Y96_00649000 [Aphelenchoides besseyi]
MEINLSPDGVITDGFCKKLSKKVVTYALQSRAPLVMYKRGLSHNFGNWNINYNTSYFVIPGLLNGVGNRLVVPLKVRTHPKSKDSVVYFIFNSVIIQDISVCCRRSGEFSEVLKDVNLLGSQFLLRSNTSIIFSLHAFEFFLRNRSEFSI